MWTAANNIPTASEKLGIAFYCFLPRLIWSEPFACCSHHFFCPQLVHTYMCGSIGSCLEHPILKETPIFSLRITCLSALINVCRFALSTVVEFAMGNAGSGIIALFTTLVTVIAH